MFKISKSTANNIFNYWQKILEKALPASLLEQVKKWEENEEEIKKIKPKKEELTEELTEEEKKKIKKYHPKEYLSNI